MTIRTGTAVFVRGPSSVQVGGDADYQLVLEGIDTADALALIAAARTLTFRPGSSVRAPMRLLDARLAWKLGRLERTAPMSRRIRLRVDGISRASAIAISLLAEECAQSIEIHDPRPLSAEVAMESTPENIGIPTERAIASHLHAHFPTLLTPERSSADLVIVSAERTVVPEIIARLLAEDVPHVLVVRTEAGYDVGPLVVPGRSACFGCLTSARAEADPFSVHAMLAASSWPLAPTDARTAHRAALAICDVVSAFARGRADSATNRMWSIGVDGEMVARQVSAHADCGCGAAGAPFLPA